MKCPKCGYNILGERCDICGYKVRKIKLLNNKIFCGLMGMLLIIVVSFICFVPIINPFPKNYISLDEYNQIEVGMNYNDVVDIIGYKGDIMSQVKPYTTIQFNGNGFIKGNAIIIFNGMAVDSKTEYGLK